MHLLTNDIPVSQDLCIPLAKRWGGTRPGGAPGGLLHDLLNLLDALQTHRHQRLDQAVVQLVHAWRQVGLHQHSESNLGTAAKQWVLRLA